MSAVTDHRPQVKNNRLLNLIPRDVCVEPFPHITKKDFIETSLYARLKAEFPPDEVFSRNTTAGGRSGRDLYRGDKAYDDFLKASPAWREFHDYINSSAYLDFALELFGDYLEKLECKVSRAGAHFVDYIEPREVLRYKSKIRWRIEMAAQKIAKAKQKDEIFVRLDLAQGAVGYGKAVHCDRGNRLTSMIVYFCNAEDIAMQGGELLLHEHIEKRPGSRFERHPKPQLTRVIGTVIPDDNLGLLFLCSNNSYHSATPVKAQRGYRNFIYVSLSSRSPMIW